VLLLVLLGAPLRPAMAQQLTGLEPGILIIQRLVQVATSGTPQAVVTQQALGKTMPAISTQLAAVIAQGGAPAVLTAALAIAQAAAANGNTNDQNQQGQNQQGQQNQQE
jgi:hypothetical protein